VNPRQIEIWDLSTASENPLSSVESSRNSSYNPPVFDILVDDRNKIERTSSTTRTAGPTSPALWRLGGFPPVAVPSSPGSPPFWRQSPGQVFFILHRPRSRLRTGIAIQCSCSMSTAPSGHFRCCLENTMRIDERPVRATANVIGGKWKPLNSAFSESGSPALWEVATHHSRRPQKSPRTGCRNWSRTELFCGTCTGRRLRGWSIR